MSGPDDLKTPRRNVQTSAAGNAIVMPRFNISFLANTSDKNEITKTAPKKNLDITLLHEIISLTRLTPQVTTVPSFEPREVAKAKAKPKAGPAGLKLPKTWGG